MKNLNINLVLITVLLGGVGFWWWRKKKTEEAANTSGLPSSTGTLSAESADIYAGRLYDAMKCVGTKEDEIEAVRQVIVSSVTPGDTLKDIVRAFGKKNYAATGSWNVLGLDLGRSYNLKEWLNAELSKTEFAKWSTLFDMINM